MLDFDFFFQQTLVGLDLNVSWAPIGSQLRSSQREQLGSVCFEQAHLPLCCLCSFFQSLGRKTINPGFCHFELIFPWGYHPPVLRQNHPCKFTTNPCCPQSSICPAGQFMVGTLQGALSTLSFHSMEHMCQQWALLLFLSLYFVLCWFLLFTHFSLDYQQRVLENSPNALMAQVQGILGKILCTWRTLIIAF